MFSSKRIKALERRVEMLEQQSTVNTWLWGKISLGKLAKKVEEVFEKVAAADQSNIQKQG
jgi:hypothetical protein